MKMTKHSMNVAGIDTGKAVLDIAVHGRAECWQVSNDLAGWRRLAEILWDADVGRIGIEASGGYERGVVAYLREAGFGVSLHQPIQVKAFATMRLRRAKNDRLDAHLIAPSRPSSVPSARRRTSVSKPLRTISPSSSRSRKTSSGPRRGSSIRATLACGGSSTATSPALPDVARPSSTA